MTDEDIMWLQELARKAGIAIMSFYKSNDLDIEVKTDSKGVKSPLTAADTASHELIVKGLREKYPDVPIVSEEQDIAISVEAMTHSKAWVIDPIDGTKGFIKQNGQFTINIGLVEGGVPRYGVVFAPAFNLMYFNNGNGAFLDEGNGPIPIHASQSTEVTNAVASKNHMDDDTSKFLEQFGDINIVQASSSLKIVKVATGEAEVYPRLAPTTMEWDTAAADAVVRAAGGKIIDRSGKILSYNKKGLRNQGFVVQSPNINFQL